MSFLLLLSNSFHEKCPNMEYFLVRTSNLSVFSPNTVKYGPENNPYLDTFHADNIVLPIQY